MLKLHSCATNYIIIHIDWKSYYYYSESVQISNIKQNCCKKKEHGERARGREEGRKGGRERERQR